MPSMYSKIFRPKKKAYKPFYRHSGHLIQKSVRFRHSGKSGDIIYSLPFIKEMNFNTGDAELYLNIVQPHSGKIDKHFSEKTAEMLIPLLQAQPYLNSAALYRDQEYDTDLDAFRYIDMPLDRSCLPNWYSFAFNIFPDLTQPWLVADKKEDFKDYIIVARSKRNHNPNISYSFLNKYKHVAFVGTQKEYEAMKSDILKLEWAKIKDFKEMADIIDSSRLFIGNQSMPYAIAEALKTVRILETPLASPTNIPIGRNGYDCIYQEALEETVSRLLGH